MSAGPFKQRGQRKADFQLITFRRCCRSSQVACRFQSRSVRISGYVYASAASEPFYFLGLEEHRGAQADSAEDLPATQRNRSPPCHGAARTPASAGSLGQPRQCSRAHPHSTRLPTGHHRLRQHSVPAGSGGLKSYCANCGRSIAPRRQPGRQIRQRRCRCGIPSQHHNHSRIHLRQPAIASLRTAVRII